MLRGLWVSSELTRESQEQYIKYGDVPGRGNYYTHTKPVKFRTRFYNPQALLRFYVKSILLMFKTNVKE